MSIFILGSGYYSLMGNGERKVVIIGVSEECDDPDGEELLEVSVAYA